MFDTQPHAALPCRFATIYEEIDGRLGQFKVKTDDGQTMAVSLASELWDLDQGAPKVHRIDQLLGSSDAERRFHNEAAASSKKSKAIENFFHEVDDPAIEEQRQEQQKKRNKYAEWQRRQKEKALQKQKQEQEKAMRDEAKALRKQEEERKRQEDARNRAHSQSLQAEQQKVEEQRQLRLQASRPDASKLQTLDASTLPKDPCPSSTRGLLALNDTRRWIWLPG